MVDTVDLIFVQDLFDFLIELFRRFKIATERLFDHHPPPVAIFFASQTDRAQLLDHGRKVFRRGRQVEEVITFGLALLVGFFQ